RSPFRIAGAQAHGEVIADFFSQFDDYSAPRLRTGFIELQWPSTAIRAGIEKPIVAPRNPTSLASVIYPALWGSGNLWLWQPQFRLEQKFAVGGGELNWQVGLLQTNDQRAVPSPNTAVLQPRPGWETRVGWKRTDEEGRGWELAPGFHY